MESTFFNKEVKLDPKLDFFLYFYEIYVAKKFVFSFV